MTKSLFSHFGLFCTKEKEERRIRKEIKEAKRPQVFKY
jgi:hypothetical protein